MQLFWRSFKTPFLEFFWLRLFSELLHHIRTFIVTLESFWFGSLLSISLCSNFKQSLHFVFRFLFILFSLTMNPSHQSSSTTSDINGWSLVLFLQVFSKAHFRPFSLYSRPVQSNLGGASADMRAAKWSVCAIGRVDEQEGGGALTLQSSCERWCCWYGVEHLPTKQIRQMACP